MDSLVVLSACRWYLRGDSNYGLYVLATLSIPLSPFTRCLSRVAKGVLSTRFSYEKWRSLYLIRGCTRTLAGGYSNYLWKFASCLSVKMFGGSVSKLELPALPLCSMIVSLLCSISVQPSEFVRPTRTRFESIHILVFQRSNLWRINVEAAASQFGGASEPVKQTERKPKGLLVPRLMLEADRRGSCFGLIASEMDGLCDANFPSEIWQH